MFYHTVLMELSDVDETFLAKVEHYADRIRRELPYVRDYRFAKNCAARAQGYDWVVIGVFDTGSDHDAYQISPAHQEMKAHMKPLIARLIACDFDSGHPIQ